MASTPPRLEEHTALPTNVDAGDPDDIKAVNSIQDQIKVDRAATGTFEVPDWDHHGLKELTDALNIVANTMLDYSGCFGTAPKPEKA